VLIGKWASPVGLGFVVFHCYYTTGWQARVKRRTLVLALATLQRFQRHAACTEEGGDFLWYE
jgi:hypothetical protein